MVRLSLGLVALAQLFALGSANDCSAFRKHCLSFKPESLVKNSTLTRLEFVTNGTIVDLSDNVPSCDRTSQQVGSDLCRVGLQIPTSKRSSISFELWLPRQWEDARYLATGNGGVDGCRLFQDGTHGCTNVAKASNMRIWHTARPMALPPWAPTTATTAPPP